MKKIKVIHGTYIEYPKCIICSGDITHEYLGGDYTLLICADIVCLNTLSGKYVAKINELVRRFK